jgi:hypothetical protein
MLSFTEYQASSLLGFLPHFVFFPFNFVRFENITTKFQEHAISFDKQVFCGKNRV